MPHCNIYYWFAFQKECRKWHTVFYVLAGLIPFAALALHAGLLKSDERSHVHPTVAALHFGVAARRLPSSLHSFVARFRTSAIGRRVRGRSSTASQMVCRPRKLPEG